MALQSQSLEVSKHTLLVHIREHVQLSNVSDEFLNQLNIFAQIPCKCRRSEIITCVICSLPLILHVKDGGKPCPCVKELHYG